jgi:cytochrome c peroxidase
MKKVVFYLSLSFILFSCKKEGEISPIQTDSSDKISFLQPSNFPSPIYTYSNNPLTKKGFELGRFLFYDPLLSLDSSISCGTCHAQGHAFADHNIPLSKGVKNKLGIRNAPSLVNLAWSTSFMWDGGVNHIEVQPLVPLTSEHEMGETMAQIVLKLNRSEFYKQKFKEAFGVTKITDQKLLHALAQFTSMLVSSNSKYDQVIAGKDQFTTEEKQGYELFKLNCALCHTEPLFTDYSFRNSGLPIDLIDTGREKVSQDAKDRGKFKVPTLRNIAYTYPYMHDGRFSNLEEVLKFKVQGIQDSPTLDPYLKKGIKLNTQEQKAIISFLNTLTDFNFIGNTLFSEPVR